MGRRQKAIVVLLGLCALLSATVRAAPVKGTRRVPKSRQLPPRNPFVQHRVHFVKAASSPTMQKVPETARSVVDVMGRFSSYDWDGDGTQEIRSLSLLPFESAGRSIEKSRRLMLVLVSPNVLLDGLKIPKEQLIERLRRWKGDLAAENCETRFIVADVYGSKPTIYERKHQDGKTLLALREFFRAVRRVYGGSLVGAVLVGPFPEAMLVRRWIWQDEVHDEITVNGVQGSKIGGKFFPKGTRRFRYNAEITAERADIVLADLGGSWEKIYVASGKAYGVEGIPDAATDARGWPRNGGVVNCPDFRETSLVLQDCFFIDDARCQMGSWDPKTQPLHLKVFSALRHPEISPSELKRPNPHARPDIVVSRINARNIARNPSNREGKSLLDDKGVPTTVLLKSYVIRNDLTSYFLDKSLERRILNDYFDRNHAHRRKLPVGTAYRGAVLTCPERQFPVDSLVPYAELASDSFKGKVLKAPKDPTPVDFVRWLKTPAVLRVITAHAHCLGFGLSAKFRPEELLGETRGRPFWWTRSGTVQDNGSTYTRWVPSFAEQKGFVAWSLLRTLYESKILHDKGSNMFIHCGCKYNSPWIYKALPFNDESYAPFQGAESLLFFANGLALMARAKTFYDHPKWFTKSLSFNHGTQAFGRGWQAYFANVSMEEGKIEKFDVHKKAYNWSILGDWTLQLKY